MDNNAIFRNRIKHLISSEEKPKVVALLNLARALRNERYEECAGLIRIARKSGIKEGDISKIIAKSIRSATLGRRLEAYAKGEGRWRWH